MISSMEEVILRAAIAGEVLEGERLTRCAGDGLQVVGRKEEWSVRFLFFRVRAIVGTCS
jgi:hypothetical protein